MASGSVNFNGKWKCYKDENFEAYLKATGYFALLLLTDNLATL